MSNNESRPSEWDVQPTIDATQISRCYQYVTILSQHITAHGHHRLQRLWICNSCTLLDKFNGWRWLQMELNIFKPIQAATFQSEKMFEPLANLTTMQPKAGFQVPMHWIMAARFRQVKSKASAARRWNILSNMHNCITFWLCGFLRLLLIFGCMHIMSLYVFYPLGFLK